MSNCYNRTSSSVHELIDREEEEEEEKTKSVTHTTLPVAHDHSVTTSSPYSSEWNHLKWKKN